MLRFHRMCCTGTAERCAMRRKILQWKVFLLETCVAARRRRGAARQILAFLKVGFSLTAVPFYCCGAAKRQADRRKRELGLSLVTRSQKKKSKKNACLAASVLYVVELRRIE